MWCVLQTIQHGAQVAHRGKVTYGGDLIVMVAWKLCGKCSHEVKRNGGKVPDSLMREAESVSKAALLAMTETGGTA